MSRAKSSSEGRQHYVPRFYLRNFGVAATSKNKAHQIVTRDIVSDRRFVSALENVGGEYGFYDAVNEDGSSFSADPAITELEKLIHPGWQRLVDNAELPTVLQYGDMTARFIPVTDEDFWAVALFCATLMTRTPGFRKIMRSMNDNVLDHARILQERFLPDRPESIDYLRLDENTLIRETSAATLDHARGFANIIRHHIWVVSTVPKGTRLITSDNPVIRVFAENGVETERLVPMSPEKLLGFIPREQVKDPVEPRYLLHELGKEDVAWHNWRQRQQAVRFLFAQEGEDLSKDTVDIFRPCELPRPQTPIYVGWGK